MRPSLGEREPPQRRRQVVREQDQRDVVRGLRSPPQRIHRLLETRVVMRRDLERAPGGILQRFVMSGEREARLQRDDRRQRLKVVGQRIRPRFGPQPDVRGDRAEQRVTRHQHAVTKQRQMPVGVAREVQHLPAVHRVPRLERLRIADEAHEPREHTRLPHERVHLGLRRAMRAKVLGHQLHVPPLAPDTEALLVVLAPLEHRRAGQIDDVGRCADVVGMEMRDHDPPDRTSEVGQQRTPPIGRVGQPEPRVDERPAAVRRGEEVAVHVVDPEGESERHAFDAAVQVLHCTL